MSVSNDILRETRKALVGKDQILRKVYTAILAGGHVLLEDVPGVGKTTLAAAMVRHLTECKPDARILAIDADPAVGLSTCLGVEVTLTLDEIRKQIIDNVEEGRTKEAMDLVEESRYRIFDALVEKNGFAFPVDYHITKTLEVHYILPTGVRNRL